MTRATSNPGLTTPRAHARRLHQAAAVLWFAALLPIFAWAQDSVAPPTAGSSVILSEHAGEINALVFSPDGRQLVAAGSNGTIRIWELSSRKAVRSLAGHKNAITSVAFAPDGRRLASGYDDATVALWDLDSGKELRHWRSHQFSVFALSFGPDGRWLATAGSDTTVKVWQANSGHEVRTLRAHNALVCNVAFEKQGKWLASVEASGLVLYTWDPNTWSGRPVWELNGGPLGACPAFSGDGKLVASSDGSGNLRMRVARSVEEAIKEADQNAQTRAAANQPRIVVREVITGKEVQTISLEDGRAFAIALSGDGRLLATAGQAGAISVWQVEGGRKLSRIAGHGSGVEALVFSPDGRWVASAGRDEIIRLWELAKQ